MNLNNIDLNKLNTFLLVAELGGIAPVSEHLLLTRSAISQSISSLERSLGIRLFHRVGKKLLLTPEGKELFMACREHQAGLQKAVEKLTRASKEISGVVRIGLFIGFSRGKLTDFLSTFLNNNPLAQLKVLFAPHVELHNLLIENKIECAFSLHPFERESRLISSTQLFNEELILVSGRKYFIPHPSFKDIQALPVIDYYQNGQLFRSWIRHHFKKDLSPRNIRAFAATIDFAIDLILQNVGVGIVPYHAAEPYLKDKRLFQIRMRSPELMDSIWMNEIKGLQHGSASQAFFSLLREQLISLNKSKLLPFDSGTASTHR